MPGSGGFDRFRYEYNQERPHEALGLKPPLSAYAPSPRRYPRPPEQFEDDSYAVFVDPDPHLRVATRDVVLASTVADPVVGGAGHPAPSRAEGDPGL